MRAIEEYERAKTTREIRLALELVKEAARYSSKGNETLSKTVQTAATLVGGNGGSTSGRPASQPVPRQQQNVSSVPFSSTVDPNLAGNTRPTERYQNESVDSEDSSEEFDAPVSSTRFEQSINKLCQSFLAGQSSGKA